MKTTDDNFLIAEFMGWPKVTVGSIWNYNRSLDHSTQTQNLVVAEINDKGVRFEQEMAFKHYGLDFFDGSVFYPADWAQKYYNMNSHHCPIRPYHTSWDWLMPVIQKIKPLAYTIDIDSTAWRRVSGCSIFSKHEDVYRAVVEFIKYHNEQGNNKP